jgi:predicted transcriptional regulator
MKVLLSIKPEYVEKIFSGKKNTNTESLFLLIKTSKVSWFTAPCQ